MLAVARECAPQIEWRLGQAEALPFAAESFDAVVSQFGLMFFQDRVKAIQEMMRVLRPHRYLAIAVWAALESSPGYLEMVDLLQRLFGDEVAGHLRAPFVLGDVTDLRDLCRAAGIPEAKVSTVIGKAQFPSIQQWVFTEIKGWTLADAIDDAQYALLLAEAEKGLQRYALADGTVSFDSPAHVITHAK
jgi:SAM-dependent methyltransferase